MEVLHELTPLVEQLSIDEAFIEVTGIEAEIEDIARDLQRRIRGGLGLPCSLGVSSNKLVAKIATDVGKAASKNNSPPNAITIVPAGEEAAFLAPLPVEMLWGVGGKTAEKLGKLGITTIGDLAQHSEWDLVRELGKVGWDLTQRARGIDKRPIVTSRQAKSISQEVTFAHDLDDGGTLRQTLRDQAGQVAKRLGKQNLTAKTVKLKLRWPDFTTLTRQMTLPKPTNKEETIGKAAIQLFERVWENGRAVRLLGVGVSGLDSPPRQIGLWDSATTADAEKERRLQAAIKALHERFGEQVLWRGTPEERK
jgi:nucleotidyltransferase/DNA polymerase involved in DNA repair